MIRDCEILFTQILGADSGMSRRGMVSVLFSSLWVFVSEKERWIDAEGR